MRINHFAVHGALIKESARPVMTRSNTDRGGRLAVDVEKQRTRSDEDRTVRTVRVMNVPNPVDVRVVEN